MYNNPAGEKIMKNKSLKKFFGTAVLLLSVLCASTNVYAAKSSSTSGGFPVPIVIIPVVIVIVVAILVVVSKNISRNNMNGHFTGQQPPPPPGYGGQNGNYPPYGSTPSPYGSSDPYYGDPSRQNTPDNVGQGNFQSYVPGVFSSQREQNNNSRNSSTQQNNGSDPIALKCPNCGAPLGESDDVTTCPYCRSVLTNANIRAGRRRNGPIDFSAQDSVFNGFGDDAVHTGYGEESYHNSYGNGYGLGFDDNDFE